MRPTIGRIVHYYEGDSEAGGRHGSGTNGTRFHPAVITRVWSDTCVNLTVFFDGAAIGNRTSTSELPDAVFAEDVHCTNSGWRWPARA